MRLEDSFKLCFKIAFSYCRIAVGLRPWFSIRYIDMRDQFTLFERARFIYKYKPTECASPLRTEDLGEASPCPP